MSNCDKIFVNSDNKMLLALTIQENSSQIYIKQDGMNYCVWSKILEMEMHIAGRTKKGLYY
jgi:hypothetical protein